MYVNLTLENIEQEHLCCAIADTKHQIGVSNKKEWLKKEIPQGHIFRKLQSNGKVFIEYGPGDTAWASINAKNFMYIYCLWVAGSYKNHNYGHDLLEYAIQDAKAKNMAGICVITSKKKKPFLSEGAFFKHYNFKVVDTIDDFELLSLNFGKDHPTFSKQAHLMKIDNSNFTIYYSMECPYISNCLKECQDYANEKKININFIEVKTYQEAQNVPCIFNNWATFKNGKFLANTLLNRNSLEKALGKGE